MLYGHKILDFCLFLCLFNGVHFMIFDWHDVSSIESNKAMAEICDIGKCHQIATTEAMMRAKDMFDTLRKNDVCEEYEAIQKKYVSRKTYIRLQRSCPYQLDYIFSEMYFL